MYQRDLEARQKELEFQEKSKKRAAAAKKQMVSQKASKNSLEQQKIDRYKKAMDCKKYKEDVPQKKQPVVIIDDSNLESNPLEKMRDQKIVETIVNRPKSGQGQKRGKSSGRRN